MIKIIRIWVDPYNRPLSTFTSCETFTFDEQTHILTTQ